MAWRKSWSRQNLEPGGTKRKLTPAQRSIWDDLLDLAETKHDGGKIAAFDHVGFSIEQLADIFNITAHDVKDALERFIILDMITMNKHGVILIKKWTHYQSDYDRVKAYREKKHK